MYLNMRIGKTHEPKKLVGVVTFFYEKCNFSLSEKKIVFTFNELQSAKITVFTKLSDKSGI